MVNVGKRSNCCFTCRKRRVKVLSIPHLRADEYSAAKLTQSCGYKCDLQKPHCRRCTQAGRPCAGYPDAWSTVLRIQNDHTKQTVATRVARAQLRRLAEAQNVVAEIPNGIQIAPEVHSWNRFYRDYVVNSDIVLFGILAEFHADCRTLCFQEALSAVTLASSAQQLCQPDLMRRARQHYGKAMTLLNIALNQHSRRREESVLLTLSLFTLFEMIVPAYQHVNLQCNVHLLGGTLSLLRWRSDHGIHSQLDESILAFTQHICLMSFFINHDEWNKKLTHLEEVTSFMTTTLTLWPAVAAAVKFKRQVRTMTSASVASHLSPSARERIVADGLSIVNQLQTVAVGATHPSYRGTPSHQPPRAFNDLYGISSNTTKFIVKCLYWSLGYDIIDIVANVSNAMANSCDKVEGTSVDDFVSLASCTSLEEICVDLDTAIGIELELDGTEEGVGIGCRAFGTFWPLAILSLSPSIGQERRTWVHEKLRIIGTTSGFGLATWTADMMTEKLSAER